MERFDTVNIYKTLGPPPTQLSENVQRKGGHSKILVRGGQSVRSSLHRSAAAADARMPSALLGFSARFACGNAAAARGRNAKSASSGVWRVLTYDVEMYEVAHVRRGADLTLVDAGVAVLRVLDLQRPLVRVRVMDGPEALVARVRVPAHGQQVDVAMPHPRDLQHIPIGW